MNDLFVNISIVVAYSRSAFFSCNINISIIPGSWLLYSKSEMYDTNSVVEV